MGQNEILTMVLAIVIIAVTIITGIQLFAANKDSADEDAMINTLNNIAASAYQYKIRPQVMGGGGGVYTGFNVPIQLTETADGSFSVDHAGSELHLVATSRNGKFTMFAIFSGEGKMKNLARAGAL